jgi:iron complex transport system substrate-binding protein
VDFAMDASRKTFLALAVLLLALPGLLLPEPIAQRIVSTAPSSTETLFALGLGQKVVGVSLFCTYPPEVKKLPKVGTYLKPDAEAIARLAPDLVVLQRVSGELTNRLTALHIRYIEVPHGTFDDVFSAIQQIGTAAGIPQRGAELIHRIQSSLQHTQSQAAALRPTRALLIVGRNPGTLSDLIAVGPDNYLNHLSKVAGATNVLDKPGIPAYPRISLETVLRENPDVIVDLTGMEESDEERVRERSATLALWRQRSELSAVRNNRVYSVSSNVFVVPGPRAAEAADLLFHYFHDAPKDK